MIPANKRVPGSYVEVDESGANRGLPAYRQPILIVGPRIKTPAAWTATAAAALGSMIKPTTGNDDGHYYICIVAGNTGATEPAWPGAGGSVSDGTVTWREVCDASKFKAIHTPFRIYSPDEAAQYSGAGSIAHRMARAAIRQYRESEVSIILVDDDDAGVKSTSTIVFAGTADGQGSAELRIGNDRVLLSWADEDTAAEIAAAAATEIAKYHDLPVTPSVSNATVTLQAKNAGVPGNEIGKYDSEDTKWNPVITVTGSGITATVTGFGSGANNPDITDALAAANVEAYALVATPYKDTDNLAALVAYMAQSANYENCNGVRAFLGITSTISLATTLAIENEKRLHVDFVRGCRYVSFEIAAAAAAMHAQTGHPALPLNTMEMVDCDAPDIEDRFEPEELNALLWAGVTPFNSDGSGAVRCVRSISTYTKNAAGSPDPLYLDTTTIACHDYSRRVIKEAHLLRFSQKVLRENHVDGEPDFIVTPDDIASFNFMKCKELERYGVMQQVDLYKDKFISLRDPDVAGRVNSDIPVEVVQGCHVLANTIRVQSSTQS